MFEALKLRRASLLALALVLALVLGAAGPALGAVSATALSSEARAVSIPMQHDVVLNHGETVIFIGCHSHVPCSGVVTVRLAPSDALVAPASDVAGTRTSRRAAAWLRRREASADMLVARHRVRLRQRRVTPVGLRLPARVLSLLAFVRGPLAFRVLVQEPRHAPVEGSILLQLASSRGRIL